MGTEMDPPRPMNMGIGGGMPWEEANPYFKAMKCGWGIQPMGVSPTGEGDIHDTFHLDSEGHISGGHTTVQLPGFPNQHIPW